MLFVGLGKLSLTVNKNCSIYRRHSILMGLRRIQFKQCGVQRRSAFSMCDYFRDGIRPTFPSPSQKHSWPNPTLDMKRIIALVQIRYRPVLILLADADIANRLLSLTDTDIDNRPPQLAGNRYLWPILTCTGTECISTKLLIMVFDVSNTFSRPTTQLRPMKAFTHEKKCFTLTCSTVWLP